MNEMNLKLVAVKLAQSGNVAFYRIADMNKNIQPGGYNIGDYKGVMEDIWQGSIRKFLTNHVDEGIKIENNEIKYDKDIMKISYVQDKSLMLDVWLNQHKGMASTEVWKFNQLYKFPTLPGDIARKSLYNPNNSAPEVAIALFLKMNNIEFKRHYIFNTKDNITKEFDFYIQKHNLCIEYNSPYHRYDRHKQGDQNSAYVAQKLGLRLLEICEVNNQYNPAPGNFRICYDSSEASAFKFKNMLQQLSNWLNLNYSLNTSVRYNRQIEDIIYVRSQAFKVQPEKSVAALLLNDVSWNYERNGIITPDIVSAGSCRKYSFIINGKSVDKTPHSIYCKYKRHSGYYD